MRGPVASHRPPEASGGAVEVPWRRWLGGRARPARRVLPVALAGLAALAVAFAGLSPQADAPSHPEPRAVPTSSRARPPYGVEASPPPNLDGRYWVALDEVAGLPPAVRPGQRFTLWALWEPPLVEEPRLQRLVRDAFVVEIAPALDPGGSPALKLAFPRTRTDELIYGDLFGRLSAVPVGE